MKIVSLTERQLIMPGNAAYLPFATGLLMAFAKKHLPSDEWDFRINEEVKAEDLYISAHSVSLWNYQYSINEAKKILKKNYKCRVIFGGPSACEVNNDLHQAEIIEGDGETVFLKRISGIEAPEILTLDDIPSPYLTGLFNKLITPNSQAIIETNRGCPFSCAYCFWGARNKKVRFHSLEYIKAEAEWIGINKIKYVFCADGNFGMFPRDIDIARIYAEVKKKYGYPEKFRVCYGKNAEKSIFEAAAILNEAGLSKSVTISPQSRNSATLEAIGRKNISDESFDIMQRKYEESNIQVYTELIIGLPEETYETFRSGLLKSMKSNNQIFIYLCEVLPGTRLADKEYRKKYGIRTRKVLLSPVHCEPLDIPEFEDVVISTKTLSINAWKKCLILGWLVQLFYSLLNTDDTPEDVLILCDKMIKANTDIVQYFNNKAEDILKGMRRCDLVNNIYFEPEEVAYLKYFCKQGADPVSELIHIRKSARKKANEARYLHTIASQN